jgi:hypothetical protein
MRNYPFSLTVPTVRLYSDDEVCDFCSGLKMFLPPHWQVQLKYGRIFSKRKIHQLTKSIHNKKCNIIELPELRLFTIRDFYVLVAAILLVQHHIALITESKKWNYSNETKEDYEALKSVYL